MVVVLTKVVVCGALVVTGFHVIGGCHGVVGLGVGFLVVVVVGLGVGVVVVVGATVVVVLLVVVVGRLARYAWKSTTLSEVGGGGSYLCGSFSPTRKLYHLIFHVTRFSIG
jgi:hypothetical protein